MNDECTWTHDGDLGWNTTCGQNVFIGDAPAKESGVAACQHCGKPIEWLKRERAP